MAQDPRVEKGSDLSTKASAPEAAEKKAGLGKENILACPEEKATGPSAVLPKTSQVLAKEGFVLNAQRSALQHVTIHLGHSSFVAKEKAER